MKPLKSIGIDISTVNSRVLHKDTFWEPAFENQEIIQMIKPKQILIMSCIKTIFKRI